MSSPDDDPQLGHTTVDRHALEAPGVPLTELAAELGLTVGEASLTDEPVDGWRILSRQESGIVLIGAPLDSEGTLWRAAQSELRGAVITVHPDTLRLRASRAERRQGLELRWPAMMSSEWAADGFAIDVVNAGSTQWRSDGDSFHVVGVLTPPGATDLAFGWVSMGGAVAVPLEAGEYARVPVVINTSDWQRLEPGRHELHAVLVGLGVRSIHPLRVDLSAEVIAHHRRSAGRDRATPEQRRRALEEQYARAQALRAATADLERVAQAVRLAESDDAAVAALGEVLAIDPDTAREVYHSPLRELRPGNADQRLRQLEEFLDDAH